LAKAPLDNHIQWLIGTFAALLLLAIDTGIVYGSAIAVTQVRIFKLIAEAAYSSVTFKEKLSALEAESIVDLRAPSQKDECEPFVGFLATAVQSETVSMNAGYPYIGVIVSKYAVTAAISSAVFFLTRD